MYHILIRIKGTKKWVDVGPVSDSFIDTKKGIIEELSKRMPEMAMTAFTYYKTSISGKEMEYDIKESLYGNV